jgi:hypothetical protein
MVLHHRILVTSLFNPNFSCLLTPSSKIIIVNTTRSVNGEIPRLKPLVSLQTLQEPATEADPELAESSSQPSTP